MQGQKHGPVVAGGLDVVVKTGRALWAVLGVAIGTSAAIAQTDTVADVAAGTQCISARIAAGENPANCIEAALASCQAVPTESPAVAILCFRAAKDAWGAAMTEVMAEITALADDRIAAIAGVELKYDLISGLTQCNRMEELARVGSDQSPELIQRERERCEASAAALAYMRASVRGSSLK